MGITIEGLDELIRRVIREELAAQRDGWFSSRQAADYLGVSLGTLHNLVSAGRLPRYGEKGTGLRFRRPHTAPSPSSAVTRASGTAP